MGHYSAIKTRHSYTLYCVSQSYPKASCIQTCTYLNKTHKYALHPTLLHPVQSLPKIGFFRSLSLPTDLSTFLDPHCTSLMTLESPTNPEQSHTIDVIYLTSALSDAVLELNLFLKQSISIKLSLVEYQVAKMNTNLHHPCHFFSLLN